MQLSKKSRLTFVSGFTIVMMSLATCDAAAITLKEVSEVVEQMKISRYCGDKLNVAMKLFCHPRMREFILKSAAGKEVPNTYGVQGDLDQFLDQLVRAEVPDIPTKQDDLKSKGITKKCCKNPCSKAQFITFCPVIDKSIYDANLDFD